MDSIRGMAEHIVYRNEDSGYTVFNMKCAGGDVTCVGCIPEIGEGEYLRADGEFTEHAIYGRQFKIKALAVETPEDEFAMERYLGSGMIKGIGPSLAAKIVKLFGKDTFRIIEEEPERLAEVKGISARKAADIYAQFHARAGMRQAVMYLGKLGISTSMSLKIYKRYGEKIYSVLSENPYKLAEDMSGIGFKQADEIAGNAGIDKTSPFRIRSGIVYTLQQSAAAGNTCMAADNLLRQSASLLEIAPDMVQEQIRSLMIDRKIILRDEDGTDIAYLAIYYYKELETAGLLRDLDSMYEVDQAQALERIQHIEREEGIKLDPFQTDAIMKAAGRGVLVITGGPGTGKTTTINAIIRFFEYDGMDILLAAPTGRAAKRMSEASGREASTIHRMLEVSGLPDDDDDRSGTSFDRNEDNPLEADVVVIDEMSMVDIFLMNSLLKAVHEGTRLILVGDADQLPSVGPGNVLGDIIASGRFTVVSLKKIFRQALESDIVRNAHKINEGGAIALDNKSRDFFCIRRYDVMDILGITVALVRDKLPGYVHAKPYDIQVLTPMRKGDLGVERLNVILQRYLNPPSPDKKEKEIHQTLFRDGDKVMQIRNNYNKEWEVRGRYNIPVKEGTGVFNGDMGIIKEINFFAEQVTVEFDEGREAHYAFSEMDDLELAYAVTIHKSQGSEYPAVVLPLLSGPRMLMNRNILYTAVTRARKCVVIVGSDNTVLHMISNENQQKRCTMLRKRIEELADAAQE